MLIKDTITIYIGCALELNIIQWRNIHSANDLYIESLPVNSIKITNTFYPIQDNSEFP